MFEWFSGLFKKSNSSKVKINHRQNRCTLIKIPPVQIVKKDSEMSHREHLVLNSQGQNGETGERSKIKNSADRYGNKPNSSLHSQTENDTVQNQEMESNQQFDETINCRKDERLFVTDRHSGFEFLINTGLKYSIYPLDLMHEGMKLVTPQSEGRLLSESTNIEMMVYGYTTMTLDLNLGRDFEYDLVIANVSQPTLGADFFSLYGININLKKKLISLDDDSDLSVNSRLPSNITPNQHQDKEQNEEDSNVDDARVFVTDRISRTRFLADGGAQSSVFPRSKLQNWNSTPDPTLYLQQSDNTKILTYKTKDLKLDLGLNRNFSEKFLVADVKQPVIGAKFMKHNKVFVNHTDNSLKNLAVWHGHKQKYDQLYEFFYQWISFLLQFITLFIVIFFVLLYYYCYYILVYWRTFDECTAVCRSNISTKRHDELIKFLLK